MPATHSLKLVDALKRKQFYAAGQAAYQETLRTNAVFAAADVKAYVMARVAGGTPLRPKAKPLDVTKPQPSPTKKA